MLKAGRTQTLTVSRTTEHGIYLADEEQAEVLLPNRYTSLADKVGDRKEVFVYHDSEDRLVATTEQPLLRVGEAGYLRVVDKTAHGAFLDWGLHGKDLFLPNRNQQGGILIGHSYVVYLYEDNVLSLIHIYHARTVLVTRGGGLAHHDVARGVLTVFDAVLLGERDEKRCV